MAAFLAAVEEQDLLALSYVNASATNEVAANLNQYLMVMRLWPTNLYYVHHNSVGMELPTAI